MQTSYLSPAFESPDCQEKWKLFLEEHLPGLFQTALLLTADPECAEAALMNVIDEVDLSHPPEQHDLSRMQQRVAAYTPPVPTADSPIRLACAIPLLQPSLRPVLELSHGSRICYVWRALLGYSLTSCAQLLGVDESYVTILLQNASLQLQRAVNATAHLAGSKALCAKAAASPKSFSSV